MHVVIWYSLVHIISQSVICCAIIKGEIDQANTLCTVFEPTTTFFLLKYSNVSNADPMVHPCKAWRLGAKRKACQ